MPRLPKVLVGIGAVLPLLVLSGCFDDPYGPLREKIERANKLALICLRDVGHVPFEHSGNCIAASRYFWDSGARRTPEMRVCFDEQSLVCHRIGDREQNAMGTLNISIAQSLFRFGKPRLVIEEERSRTHNLRQSGFNFYRSMPDLEAAFAACHTQHLDPPRLPRDDLPKVIEGKSVVAMPPLQNHDCIPEGADLFGSRPLP